MEEFWFDNMMEITTKVNVTVEEVIGLSEELSKLDFIIELLESKGSEYSVYAKELKYVAKTLEILTTRIRHSFDNPDREENKEEP